MHHRCHGEKHSGHWPFYWMGGFGHGGGPFGRGGHGPPPPPPPPGAPPFMHGGPPPWVLELMGMKPRRAEKGEVRYLILDAIKDQDRHGYEIIQMIESKTGGSYKPSPGTVYPTLQLLEEMGLAASREEGGKRVYQITEEGQKDLEKRAEEVEEAYERLGGRADWDDFDPGDFHLLFKRARRLMHSVGRSFRRGRLGPDQLRDIRDALEEALERVEKALRNKG